MLVFSIILPGVTHTHTHIVGLRLLTGCFMAIEFIPHCQWSWDSSDLNEEASVVLLLLWDPSCTEGAQAERVHTVHSVREGITTEGHLEMIAKSILRNIFHKYLAPFFLYF